jgi:hypothetical protein
MFIPPRLGGYAAFLTFLALGGCQGEPPFNFAVQDVKASGVQVPEDLRSITVTLAHPYEKTGPLPPQSNIIVEPMKEALTDAIDHAAMFQDDARTHVNLAATVMKLDLPDMGFTMETEMDCRYVVIDRATGQTLFTSMIASKGDVPMGFAFLGTIRAKESVNRAVQNNIAALLVQLEASKLAMPRAAPLIPGVVQPDTSQRTSSL